ncbi:MAG TPA: M15 family metallopeptidase [Nevskiaceae bacterium]|nr:M15 family metallopeptidase [Nevskiaceae bacterium]
MRSLRRFGIIAIVLAVAMGGGVFVVNRKQPDDTTNPATGSTAPSFDKQKYATTDPVSMWVVVNKTRPLNPKTYAPGDLIIPSLPLRLGSGNGEMQLRAPAAQALEAMAAAAQNEAGLKLMLASGYRSYNLQVSVYNAEVKSYGQAKADTESARPGYSEHQTGLAADIEPASRKCEVADCFGSTPEGQWLAANAYKYGFIIRYLPDKQGVTGYRAEPWHVRYIGTELSNELHKQGITTLEEFFDLPAAPHYLQ